MSDSISRQDAVNTIKRYRHRLQGKGQTYGFLLEEFEHQIPSAETKTGRWIKATGMMPPEFHGHHCCSECGNFANMEPPFGNREDLSKFCPNCGARMLGEEGEEEK